MLPFFPGPVFAWVFVATLLGFLAVAAVLDYRWLIVPKWLTLSMLALGAIANGVRGGCLPADVGSVLDGLLFALAGFGTGFGLFFVMWILGTCGGGDVKLFAALGSWVGATLAFFLLCGTLVLVVVITAARLTYLVLAGGPTELSKQLTRPKDGTSRTDGKNPRRRAMTSYSLPVALSAAAILLWHFRVELLLAPAPPAAGAMRTVDGSEDLRCVNCLRSCGATIEAPCWQPSGCSSEPSWSSAWYPAWSPSVTP
jgi:prepilin peptidase CpaA